MHVCMYGWKDGRVDGWMEGGREGWMDGCVWCYTFICSVLLLLLNIVIMGVFVAVSGCCSFSAHRRSGYVVILITADLSVHSSSTLDGKRPWVTYVVLAPGLV